MLHRRDRPQLRAQLQSLSARHPKQSLLPWPHLSAPQRQLMTPCLRLQSPARPLQHLHPCLCQHMPECPTSNLHQCLRQGLLSHQNVYRSRFWLPLQLQLPKRGTHLTHPKRHPEDLLLCRRTKAQSPKSRHCNSQIRRRVGACTDQHTRAHMEGWTHRLMCAHR